MISDRSPVFAAGILLSLLSASPTAAQTLVQPYATPPVFNVTASDPATELGVYLRELADNPHDLTALIGAGRAALAAGDANAAIGFFGRADEASPGNARIKAGLGAAMVQLEQPREALRLFDQAAGAGMPAAEIATDRGLAYDLRGDNRRAQAEYQVALRMNPRDDEATRRYALSLAIAGDRAGALALLDPLMRRQDKAAWRASAFVLALTGDPAGAVQRTELLLPRPQAAMIAPFFPRLVGLSAAQKASAVHFGRFPGDGRPLPDTQLADTRYGAGPYTGPAAPPIRTGVTDALPDGSPVTAIPSTLPDRRTVEPGFMTARLRGRAQAVAGTIPAMAAAAPPATLARTAPSASLLLPVGRPLSPGVSGATPAMPPTSVAALPPRATMIPSATAIAQPSPGLAAVPAAVPPTAPASRPSLAPIVASPPQPITILPPAAPIVMASAGPPEPVRSAARAPSSVIVSAAPPRPIAVPPVRSGPVEPIPSSAAVAAAPPQREAPPLDLAAATAIDRVERGRRRPAAAMSGGTTDDLLAVTLPGDLPPSGRTKAPAADASEDKAAARAKAKADTAAAKKLADAKAKKADDAKAAAKAKADKLAVDKAAKKAPERYWVQVATGANKADLPKAWAGVKGKYGAVVAGKVPWTTPLRFTNRLLVGPFASADAAQAFVNAASKAGLGASTFTSAKGQEIERVGSK